MQTPERTVNATAIAAAAGAAAVVTVAGDAAPTPVFEGRCDGVPCLYVIGAKRGPTTWFSTLARVADGDWQAGAWQAASDGDARVVSARVADGATAAQLVDASGRALAPVH